MSSIVFPFNQATRPYFSEYCIYNGLLNPKEIDQIRMRWDEKQEVDATLAGGSKSSDEMLRKTKLVFLEESEDSIWLYQRLGQLGIQCNHERYGYDLLGFHHELQLAKYREGDFFDWHMDFGAGEISHRKLSITVQLSDPDKYEGGTLQFMINQNIVSAPREKGTIIVFPSFIMHRVTPITSGTRYSVVAWLAGPPYR